MAKKITIRPSYDSLKRKVQRLKREVLALRPIAVDYDAMQEVLSQERKMRHDAGEEIRALKLSHQLTLTELQMREDQIIKFGKELEHLRQTARDRTTELDELDLKYMKALEEYAQEISDAKNAVRFIIRTVNI